MFPTQPTLGIIGLGYVGLPLAVAFGRRFATLGFDRDEERIDELRRGIDRTGEVGSAALGEAQRLHLTSKEEDLAACDTYIVAVPTPVDAHKRPDLAPLLRACRIIGPYLSPGNTVIFESTVYPGATEEVCAPALEESSGLRLNQDFFVGYSPERINPGDRKHRLETIVKVTSGSTPGAAAFIDGLYRTIIPAGTHLASSIRVAEAAKVIENVQRDVNIALVNELAILFHRLGLDTREVLEAASTKWNFLPFRPGLVGGHCIGVDPYYLTHKAQAVGHHPEIILAGRRINDAMGLHVAERVIKAMAKKGIPLPGARALVLGLAFKENCPDLRNTRVVDIVRELQSYGLQVAVHDPLVDPKEARKTYGIELLTELGDQTFDAIVLAVAHHAFKGIDVQRLRKPEAVVFDVKGMLPKEQVEDRL